MSALETAGKPHKKLGQILLEKGRISEGQLETVLKAQEKGMLKGRIGDLLVQMELVTPDDVREAWAEQIGVEFVDLEEQRIDPEALKAVPLSLVKRYSVFPYQISKRRIFLAMDDPDNVLALDDIRLITGLELKPVLPKTGQVAQFLKDWDAHANHSRQSRGTGGDELEEALKRLGDAGVLGKILGETDQKGEEVREPSYLEDDAPIVRIVNTIIQSAIKARASHFRTEPDRRGMRVRFRVDGVWHEVMNVPKYVHAPLISRLKIMADCNIAERRLLQEGHASYRVEGKDYHLRVYFNPTSLGEDAEAQILPVDNAILSLAELGLSQDLEAGLFEALSARGVSLFAANEEDLLDQMLVAALKNQDTVFQSVASIEDKMLVSMRGVSQSRVNRKAGMTFANYLRQARLKSYDVIMTGRVRDPETAEMLFGLPDKTLYAGLSVPNIAEVIRTLIYGFGMNPYLVLTQVRAIVAARRVRVPCPNCSKEETVSRSSLVNAGLDVGELSAKELTIKVSSECQICQKTGYIGTTSIFEVLLPFPSTALKALDLSGRSDYSELMKDADMTFERDALAKLLAGKTTLEEITRVLR